MLKQNFMENYKITRIYEDENSESRFEEIEIPIVNRGQLGFLSESQKVSGILFRKVEATYDYDFHNAPARQYIILLDGAIEIETSLGEKRIFKAGEVLLVEDISGKGHKTRNLKDKTRSSIFVTLE